MSSSSVRTDQNRPLIHINSVTNNPEEQSVENEIFYFGGPLFGINNPTLPCNSEVLTNSDGTRVAFCVDPRPPATRAPVGPVERGPVARESEDLFSTPDLGDDFGDAENVFENAQTVFQYAENGLNEDLELSSSEDSDMANMEENRNLLLLADAALGTYSQEGQEPAHATTPGDLPHDEEQPAHTTPTDNPPHDDEQSAEVPAGFHAINSGARTGQFAQVPGIRGPIAINSSATTGGSIPAGFTATNSAATAASTRPSQPATNQSRRHEPRTTGFNPTTGEGMLTRVCGIITPSKGTPVASKSKLKGKFRCPRCNGRFTRPRSVKDHFIKCVGKYGNPDGLSWWDHGTLADTKAWHLDHLPQAEEEGEEEEDDDEMPDEGDDEQEDGEGDDGSMVF